MSTDAYEQKPRDPSVAGPPAPFDAGPLGWLPRLARSKVRLEERLARLATDRACLVAFRWLEEHLGTSLEMGPADLLWRGSGLLRPGLVAQFSWPGRKTRLALGVETPLAHAVVDRLLGFARTDAESRRQLTPVEWGIWTFVVARTFDALVRDAGPLVPADLVLDRVGPEPFGTRDLGAIVTLRWPVRIGPVAGAVRLWVPESPFTSWLESAPVRPGPVPDPGPRFHELAGDWRALAGTVAMPRGLGRLRVGGVLPIDEPGLQGTPQGPTGAIRLVLDLSGVGGRCWFPAESVPLSGGGRLILTAPLQREPSPREAIPVSPPSEPSPSSSPSPTPGQAGMTPADVPVTLTVELGRVSLTLGRLADLRPGDVIELARHSREPVELTSGGRLVARGELVQIDTELGVRVTNVFL